jgi:16S rRNA (guanine527-N7)-methyltransferase
MIEINDVFMDHLKKYNVYLSQKQQAAFKEYADFLIESNKRFNLTSYNDVETIYIKGFLDSLSLMPHINQEGNKILDIGTGAGFPGLVIAIAAPNIAIHLLESSLKKINFLKEIIERLNLKNVTCIRSRAEEYQPSENYDYVISRAVAKMSHLVEFGYPLIKIGGQVIGYKGRNLPEEMENAEIFLKKYNIEFEVKHAHFLDTEHKFAIITKKTNISFKRRTMANIKKKPLW